MKSRTVLAILVGLLFVAAGSCMAQAYLDRTSVCLDLEHLP